MTLRGNPHLSKFASPRYSVERISYAIDTIANRLAHIKQLRLIILLEGGLPFGAALMVQLDKLGVDVTFQTLRVRSYNNMLPLGNVRIGGLADLEVRGQSVVIVDDIWDTGNTMIAVRKEIKLLRPAKLYTTCLFARYNSGRSTSDIVGIILMHKEWLVGFGMDLEGRGRGLQDVYTYIKA